MQGLILLTRRKLPLRLKSWIVFREFVAKLLGLRAYKKGLKNWERRILMENMNLKKSSIFILSKDDMKIKNCWGCEKDKLVKFRDSSTGGYLCQECMPDVYWAGVVLNNTDGIRDPKPGETYDEEERF